MIRVKGNKDFMDRFHKRDELIGGAEKRKGYRPPYWDKNRVVDPHVFVPEIYRHLIPKDRIQPRVLRSQINGGDLASCIEYNPDRTIDTKEQQEMKRLCHNGQRKLANTEIQHMIAHLDTVNDKALVFYVGAAPSMKANIYSKLFPNIKFVFVDPNEFCIYIDRWHDPHYNHVKEDFVMYMSLHKFSVEEYKHRYELDGPRSVRHYLDPKKILDKDNLDSDIGWDEESMIDFIVSTNYRFYLFEEFMTRKVGQSFNKLIKAWKDVNKDGKVLFWSDIRTNTTMGGTGVGIGRITEESPLDIDVIGNSAMNYVWLKEMTKGGLELHSMLKFRLPYMEDETIEWDAFKDQIKDALDWGVDYKKDIESGKGLFWPDGEIWMQSYAANRSAECRLWSNVSQINNPKYWDLKEHENACYHYNAIERFGATFINEYANKDLGFDCCGDCAIEAKMWDDFYTKFYPKMNTQMKKQRIWKHVENMGRITGRPLNRGIHGHVY